MITRQPSHMYSHYKQFDYDHKYKSFNVVYTTTSSLNMLAEFGASFYDHRVRTNEAILLSKSNILVIATKCETNKNK